MRRWASGPIHDHMSNVPHGAGNEGDSAWAAYAAAILLATLIIGVNTRCVSWAQMPVPFPAEFYDPGTNKFTPGPRMIGRWRGPIIAVLADRRILMFGGIDQNTETTEIFDLRDEAFHPTGGPITFNNRGTATTLPTEQVLLTGGSAGCGDTSSGIGQLYDPASGEFTSNSNMHMITPRASHAATLLRDGRVLLTGGQGGSYFTSPRPNTLIGHAVINRTAELFDSKAGRFFATGTMTEPRENHSATLLADGRVLIAGGDNVQFGSDALTSAEIYNPATGRFTPTGSMSHPHTGQTATLLSNGKVLIAGGKIWSRFNWVPSDDAELYDPAMGKFSVVGPMTSAREGHTATLLANGKVLIAGGVGAHFDPLKQTAAAQSAELYDAATGKFKSIGNMLTYHDNAIAVRLPDGRVLIAGS